MSSSMRNKKRQLNAITSAIADTKPENIERRANERAAGLETVIADLEHSLRRCREGADATRRKAVADHGEQQRRISELSRTVRKQRTDILLLIGLYIVTAAVYVYSIA